MMADQLYYEDVTEGMDIPSLEKHATTRSLVMYCACYEDFAEIHHDKDAAQAAGWDGPIVPGLFTAAFLAQMLTNWITPEGTIKKIQANYRRPHVAGDKMSIKGKVTGKREEAGSCLVDCEIWVENDKGEQTSPGSAVIALPCRG